MNIWDTSGRIDRVYILIKRNVDTWSKSHFLKTQRMANFKANLFSCIWYSIVTCDRNIAKSLLWVVSAFPHMFRRQRSGPAVFAKLDPLRHCIRVQRSTVVPHIITNVTLGYLVISSVCVHNTIQYNTIQYNKVAKHK